MQRSLNAPALRGVGGPPPGGLIDEGFCCNPLPFGDPENELADEDEFNEGPPPPMLPLPTEILDGRVARDACGGGGGGAGCLSVTEGAEAMGRATPPTRPQKAPLPGEPRVCCGPPPPIISDASNEVNCWGRPSFISIICGRPPICTEKNAS